MEDQGQIFRSLAMIEERIHEKLTVEALAQSMHFSRYHYQRLFREAVGESVMRYVARRRIALAARELAQTQLSVLEIALRYGYDSHEGFTRSFKSAMGVSPAEYRKHHSFIQYTKTEKERCAMLYSKTTDEMLKELNNLIVQARETADFTRKIIKKETDAAVFYGQFWEFMAGRAQEMAGELSGALGRITDIPRCPDQISARFLIIRAIEDAAFLSSITALQARLTSARGLPEHRDLFAPVCARYEELAENARMKAGRIAGFFNELADLIFQDMRQSAGERLQDIIRKGEEAGKRLSQDPSLPYGYIADEILSIVRELSRTPSESVSADLLEDFLFRVQIIAFAADVDLLRNPSHRALFEGISRFQEALSEGLAFFRGLSEDIFRENFRENFGENFGEKPGENSGENPGEDFRGNAAADPGDNSEEHSNENSAEDSGEKSGRQERGRDAGKSPLLERTVEKRLRDMAFQGNVLLFFLRGEVSKLGAHLDENEKREADDACGSLGEAIRLAGQAREWSQAARIAQKLAQTEEKLGRLAGELGEYGGPLGLIGEEVGHMAAAARR